MKKIWIILFVVFLQFCMSTDVTKPINPNVAIEFRLAKGVATEGYEEKELKGKKIYLNPTIELHEKDILTAQKKLEKTTESYIIMLQMNESGTEKFARLTENNIGNMLSILVNGKVLIAPVIQTKIEGGKVQITGNFNKEEIDLLFKRLTEGVK